MFHSGFFLAPSAQLLLLLYCYCLFSSFGGSFLFRNVLYFFFFLMSSFYQLFVLVVLFVSLQWHTVGAEIKVPYVENPELWNFIHLKPEVGQSIAMHASLTARKVSIVLSDTCLPSPFTMFFQNHYTLFKKCRKILGQWQIMKSRLQTWSKHCRLIAHASAFYSLLVWLWVKMCCKCVKERKKSWFKKEKKKKEVLLTVFFFSV